jgi:hypothetical protein
MKARKLITCYFMFIMAVSSSAFAKDCNQLTINAIAALDEFAVELDPVSEANLVTASKNAIKQCRTEAVNGKDKLTDAFLSSGEKICKARNAQNSAAAEAACLLKVLDVITN